MKSTVADNPENNSQPDLPPDESVSRQPVLPAYDEEESVPPVYRYVLMATDEGIPLHKVHTESEIINRGDVVEIEKADGKRDYYSVDHIDIDASEQREINIVYLIRARNSLWKSLLLLAILGASWYVIEFILGLLV